MDATFEAAKENLKARAIGHICDDALHRERLFRQISKEACECWASLGQSNKCSSAGLWRGPSRSVSAVGARPHAIARSPFAFTRFSSFSDGPSGRFSPRSHLLTASLRTLR